MVAYPSAVYAPRTKENLSGVSYDASKKTVGFVEDMTLLEAEVLAMIADLVGTGVAGGLKAAAASFHANWTAEHDADGTHKSVTISDTDVYTAAWTDYINTVTVGWVNDPPAVASNVYYKKIGKSCFVSFDLSGTSNATTVSFTLPHTSSNTVSQQSCCKTRDNASYTTTGGLVVLTANSNIASVYKDMAGAAWTNSGAKRVVGQFWYETA